MRPISHRGWALALIAVFFVLHLPILAGVSRGHPDEQYYTDAAIRMVQSGDYVTPYFADGTPRFNKPGLAYWLVAAGFQALGIGVFASRIPFLIAGCLVLWFGYLTARTLFRDETVALATVALLVSNDELHSASMRATPDILLCLGVTLGLYGFARALFGETRRGRDLFLGYGGVGFAVAAKGMLGLALLAYVFVAAAFMGRRGGSGPRRLVHAPAMLLGLLLAALWFVLVVGAHGLAAVQGFFTDQVGSRLTMSWGARVGHAGVYLVAPFLIFLPWSLVALIAARSAGATWKRFWGEFRAESIFALGWCVALMVIFSIGNMTRPRYLLPAYPLLAAWLAALLVAAARSVGARHVMRRTGAAILALMSVVCMLSIAAGVRLDSRLTIFGGVWIAAMLALYAWSRRRGVVALLVAAGLLVLLLPVEYDLWVRPILGVNPAPVVAARLEAPDLAGREVIAMGVPGRQLAQVRVLTGGRVLPRAVEASASSRQAHPSSDSRAVYVLDVGVRGSFDPAGYRVEACGYSYGKVDAGDLWEMLRSGDLAAVAARKIRPLFLAIPD